MSGQITGQVQKSLLEFDDEAGHIRCPKPNSPIYKTGYFGFVRTEN
jgi:hypothetical protein